jgi:excisionase family DNA binding protein
MTIDEIKNLTRPALRTEAADVLCCDVRTIDRAIQEGTIKSFRIGRRVFLPVKPLVALLEGVESHGN